MAKRRKQQRRSREEYRRLLAEREREGLTYGQLSKRSGVPVATLQEWARRFRREEPGERPGFVELAAGRAESGRIEIVLRGGRRLRAPLETPAGTLRDLVLLLESC